MSMPIVPGFVCQCYAIVLGSCVKKSVKKKLTDCWAADWYTFGAEEFFNINCLIFSDVDAAIKNSHRMRVVNNKIV